MFINITKNKKQVIFYKTYFYGKNSGFIFLHPWQGYKLYFPFEINIKVKIIEIVENGLCGEAAK
jgi:hypothetical protein